MMEIVIPGNIVTPISASQGLASATASMIARSGRDVLKSTVVS